LGHAKVEKWSQPTENQQKNIHNDIEIFSATERDILLASGAKQHGVTQAAFFPFRRFISALLDCNQTMPGTSVVILLP
jgi:hypothetical protein